MKHAAIVALLLVSSANAFVPASSNGRVETSIAAKKQAAPEKKSLAGRVFDLDLFSPVADQNDYGARSKKKIVTGKITDSSYVPNGLSKAQYEKIRAGEKARKEANYKAKMAKVCLYRRLLLLTPIKDMYLLFFPFLLLYRLVSLKTLLLGTRNVERMLMTVGSRA